MVRKTPVQLRREIASLKKKNAMKEAKLRKQKKKEKELRELEKELRELKRSGVFKALKKLSKKKPTEAQLRVAGKKTAKGAKSAWSVAGKIVNKLSKINV